jgi:hypothetical protein
MASDTANQTTSQVTTDADVVRITVILPGSFHKSLKVYSATVGKTIQDITQAALAEYLAAHPAGDVEPAFASKTEASVRDVRHLLCKP